MRQPRALKAATQDVCIFCSFGASSISRSVAARRRYFGNFAAAQRQHAGLAFQETGDGGWGGLAEQVEEAQPQPTPAHQPTLQPRAKTSRLAPQGTNGKRDDAAQTDRGQRHDLPPSKPLFRRFISSGQSDPSSDVNIDMDKVSRWTINRRAKAPDQRKDGQGERLGLPDMRRSAVERRQQQTLQPASNSEARNPSWSQSPRDKDYVSFDPRMAHSGGGGVLQRFEPAQATVRQGTDRSSKSFSGEQGARGGAFERGSRVTEYAMPSRSSAASREEYDEYGLPVASNTAVTMRAPSDRFRRQENLQTSDRMRFREGEAKGPRISRREAREEEPVVRKDERKKIRGRTAGRDSEREDDFDVEDYHRRKRERQAARIVAKDASKARAERRTIRLPDFISVGSLATELQLRYQKFAGILEKYGFEDVNSDFILSAENAALIAEEAGFVAITESQEPDKDLYAAPLPDDMSSLPQRPPVVTIMGHVDHGKTTILDYMRKSSIVASEHGGITQHIGAFSVPMPSGKIITFLDTPGHAAFLSMRQRGANVTDIVVLVVAADDSVMPQTLEALKHAKAANVPIIVAMNKIDKPEAKPDQVKQDLARHGVEIEDYGGDVQVVPVSGKTGQGMSDLEEAIIALSEVQDQRAQVDGPVEGWVLESSTKEVGKVATVLIRRGTLRPGDIIVAGTEYCRVRSMRDEFGNQLAHVGPGMPAEVDGWRGQPNAGDEVLQAADEQVAHDVTDLREAKLKRIGLSKDVEAINEMRKAHQQRHEREKALERARKQGLDLPEDVATENDDKEGIKKVYFIVKGDVAGSVEAVVNAISTLGNSEVQPIILKSSVGTVSESDVDHATAAGGHVISFNNNIPPTIRALAERAGTKILDHNIIYRLVDDAKTCLEDVLQPITKSRVLGEAEIAQIFDINQKRKVIKIAGCKVRNGTIQRNSKVRVLRGAENEVVYTGTFSSLKNVKKDVMEMPKGSECGMGFDDWQDFKVGDIAQCYEEWEERRTL